MKKNVTQMKADIESESTKKSQKKEIKVYKTENKGDGSEEGKLIVALQLEKQSSATFMSACRSFMSGCYLQLRFHKCS